MSRVDYTYLPRTLRNILNSYPKLVSAPSPLTTYDAYANLIRDANKRHNASIRDSLTQYELPEVSVVVTGSHGRLEGGPSSETDFIVLGNLPETLKSSPGLEMKDLDRSCIAFYQGDHRKVFPSRILDSTHLGGNEKYFDLAKQKLLEEMRNPRIKRKVKERRREYEEITDTGLQITNNKQLLHFDLENGFAFYENGGFANGKRASFKYGPLRYVQFRILEELFRLVENGKGEIILSLPTNTSQKLRSLYDKDLIKLGVDSLETLIDSYEYFLWLYHSAQYKQLNEGEVKSAFDKEEATERLGSLLRLLSARQPLIV